MEHMKTLTAIACTLCACACAFAATRQLTGLESVTDAEDSTNGGFWNTSGRGAATVYDGEAAVGAACELSAYSFDYAESDVLDTRMFTCGISPAITIHTHSGALILVVR
jgi:hypothetical protein